MVCYVIPTIAAIIHYGLRKKVSNWKNNTHIWWLNIMLLGGATFGVVDHLWNGELFLIGENIIMDLMLGIAITMSIFVVWTIIVVVDKNKIKISKPTETKH